MRTIYKYPLAITDKQSIQVPVSTYHGGPDFLHAGLDPLGKPCVWLEVDTDGQEMPVNVFLVGTGNPVPTEAACHLTSFVQGPYVWHLYV